jgi:hypothetical protein
VTQAAFRGDGFRGLRLLPYVILTRIDPAEQWGKVTEVKRLNDVLQTREAMAPKTPGKIRRSCAVRFRGLHAGPHSEEV